MDSPLSSFREHARRVRNATDSFFASLDRLPTFVVPSLVFVAALAVVFSRRPDAFLQPQFYAEDGALWFARAYNFGAFTAVFIPDAGYLQVVATLTGAFSMLFPVAAAPLFFTVVAAILEVSPAVFLATRRAARLAPSLALRLAIAFAYLALPNTWTNSVVVSYASWRLALVAFLLLVTRPKGRWGYVLDFTVVALCGLGSPQGIFLLPVALLHALVRPAERSAPFLVAATLTTAVQLWHLLTSVAARPTIPLGASVGNFCTIFANQFVYSLFLGRSGFDEAVASWPILESTLVVCVVAVAGLSLVVAVALRGPYEIRLFVLFAAVVLVATLTSATATGPTQWESLGNPGAGSRYFLFGMLSMVLALGWLATRSSPVARVAGALALATILAFGARGDWRHPAQPFHDYSSFARELDSSPSGTVVEAPIEPPGWSVKLLKR